MWDRLSDSALTAVSRAAEEADLLGQAYLGDEHLLVGLARGGAEVAARLLVQAGLTPTAARAELRELQHRGLTPPSSPTAAPSLRSLGIDLAAVQHNLEATFGGPAVDAALCRLSRRPWWRGRGRRGSPLGGRGVFFKRTLELASARAGNGGEIRPVHLLDGLLEGIEVPVGEELGRDGRRHFTELGGIVGATSPALLLLRRAGVDPGVLRIRLSEWR